ncbi:MAG: hypothetical protein MUC87_17015 [Bacteroidia bacterium]|jgi:hypothetical protein|nr:hypothetical protein [Bacteroidia bacterium]
MTAAQVFGFYRSLISASAAGKTSSQEALAGWCVLHKSTFRLPHQAAHDKLLPLRMLKRLLNCGAGEKAVTTIEGGEKHIAVFDNSATAQAMRVAHLKANTGLLPSIFISRKGLLGQPLSIGQKLSAVIIALRLLFMRGPQAQKALLLHEVFEAAALLRVLRGHGITYLHFYSPFEKDANALALLLRKHGVQVNKLPSPSLLGAHHQELITDTLSLGSPYQADELEAYRATHHFTHIQHFTPERWADYGHLYAAAPAAPPHTIGFYSHAVWLREADGHQDSGFGDHTAEKEAVKALAAYLRTHKESELLIFLHPRERKPEFAERTRAHYDAAFGGISYRFSNSTKPGTAQFDAVDVGIGGISTILFERLFAARKTLFFPAGVSAFPQPQSPIAKICPLNHEQLAAALNHALHTPVAAWLHETGAVRYTAAQWLYDKNPAHA